MCEIAIYRIYALLSPVTLELQRIDEGKIGIDLKWDYIQLRCWLIMNVYLRNLRIALRHPTPTKHQLSPHKQIAIQYGAGSQFNESPDTSQPLNKEGILRVQRIIG